MCELMGLSFERPVLADFSIRAFKLRDEENADGWGLAWYPDQSLALVKEALTWRSSGYSKFLEKYEHLQARLFIAHVRKRSRGGPPTHADTHPFARELHGREFCFAHNGTIEDHESLPLGRFTPLGGADSEWVFCHLLSLIAERNDRLESEASWRWLGDALRRINERGTLNCLLSDGQRLFAYRDRTGWKGLSLRKVRFRKPGERVLEDATTDVAVVGDDENRGWVVATQPLSETGWRELPMATLLVFEGGALRLAEKPAANKAGAAAPKIA